MKKLIRKISMLSLLYSGTWIVVNHLAMRVPDMDTFHYICAQVIGLGLLTIALFKRIIRVY